MAVEWDYGAAAAFYEARPAYAAGALDECLDVMAAEPGTRACDVGAGTGRLTRPLARRGLTVVAAEPSAAMRALGVAGTRGRPPVTWIAAVAEVLPFAPATFRVVSFGSSFNVVEPTRALRESARVLEPGGWLLCVWNHRRLDDPLQARIEAAIRARVPGYRYGARRDDQAAILLEGGLFRRVRRLERACVHRVRAGEWLRAWRSHLTLRRQAGAGFADVVAAIARVVGDGADGVLEVPYVTRAWLAERS